MEIDIVVGSIIALMVAVFGWCLYQLLSKTKVNPETPRERLYRQYQPVIDLVKREFYDRPDRFYHDWRHIEEGLDVIAENEDEFFESPQERNALILAWLFHDVVYDVTVGENEKKSAQKANTILSLRFPEYSRTGVAELIMVTKDHKPKEHDRMQKLICDLDLMRLGGNWTTFMINSNDVYEEYAGTVGNIHQFMEARAEFLEKFQSTESIYNTKWFKLKHETRARSNIAKFVKRYKTNT